MKPVISIKMKLLFPPFFFLFFFLAGVDTAHVYMHASTLHYFHSLNSTRNIRRVLIVLADICEEIRSAPLVV